MGGTATRRKIWRAMCVCGYEGPERRRRGDASGDAMVHVTQMLQPGVRGDEKHLMDVRRVEASV